MGGTEARQWTAIVALVAALFVAGCGGSESDKAGGERQQKPVVLTMANINGSPFELEAFVAAVARRSDRTIRIRFKNDWRKGTLDYETGLIADVKAGQADMGWAGSRAFGSVGVPTLDALHAPLLVDTYALERKVLQSPLVDKMLDGLKPYGLVGLGVLPGPMRKPLGVAPLLKPDDYRGKTIAMSRSRVTEQTLRALGARPKELPGGGRIETLDGIEQHVGAIDGNEYDKSAKNLSANVNLWPRPQVLFINKQSFAALTDAQRDALRGAARAALPATLAARQSEERDSAAIMCRRGRLAFLTASDADLAALRRAVEPVYDRLERDTVTKGAVEQITRMRQELGTSATAEVPRCRNARSKGGVARKITPIDGFYRVTTTASGDDVAPENYGSYTWNLDRGRFVFTQRNGVARGRATGTYSVTGRLFVFTVETDDSISPTGVRWRPGERFGFRWSLYRDLLTLSPAPRHVSPADVRAEPWRRISDAR